MLPDAPSFRTASSRQGKWQVEGRDVELFPKFGDFPVLTIATQRTSHLLDRARAGKLAMGGRPIQFLPDLLALQH